MDKLLNDLMKVAPTERSAKAAYRTWLLIESYGMKKTQELTAETTWYKHKRLLQDCGISWTNLDHRTDNHRNTGTKNPTQSQIDDQKNDKIETSDQSPIETPDRSPRFIFQDYLVDLLGGLLPGTLISVAAFISIAPAIILLLNSLSLNYESSFSLIIHQILTATKSTPSMIWLGISTILLSLFYVLGHMFYRQDPKLPNQESFAHLRNEIERNSHYKDSKELNDILEKELACKTKEECEFPFPYFDKYLENRGLNHLLKFVPWSKDDRNYRTKNYINILKMRLRFYFPDRCGTIIRNEAHVRLASSTWYAGGAMYLFSRTAIIVSITSLLIFVVGLLFLESKLNIRDTASNIASQHVGAIMIAIFIYYMGKYVRTRVEKFLHYQRMREVVHVMETAYTAFKDKPNLICPPFCKKDKNQNHLKSSQT